MDIKIYAEILEPEALAQFNEAMTFDCNVQGALMPDAHAGYTLPIGAVIKSHNRIFPAYVGYDIGCGMTSIKTDVKRSKLSIDDLKLFKEKITAIIPLGITKQPKKQKLPRVYDTVSDVAIEVFKNLAPFQIGTLGGGNHFIEIGYDKQDYVVVIIHSGSRGVGKKIAEHYMKLAAIENINKKRYEDEFDDKNQNWFNHIKLLKNNLVELDKYKKAKDKFVYRRTRAALNANLEGHFGFDLNSSLGKAYLTDMNSALQFALDNREMMINRIIECLEVVVQGKVETERFINRNHNHAEVVKEIISDEEYKQYVEESIKLNDVALPQNEVFRDYVIHRKGATHAEKGMLGVIPGNMKDGSFIVKGKGCADSMNSSSHGAGRVLSRKKAKDTLDIKEFHEAMKGIVTNHTDDTLDEAPAAYKNIFEVMELQQDLVDVIDYIKPLLNIKG